MVGLVIVSHSWKIAEGVKDLALQMTPGYDSIIAAGGLADKEIGTDAMLIKDAIIKANNGDGVVILADLGSGIMSAETAIDLLEEDIPVKLADAPIVEGAIAAAVEAATGGSIDDVAAEAEDARTVNKL
ncbi:MAG: PTS-dependent dihydroxyacetone kinase phosphotransferase subunit DhaM [Lachnospiraceae bacterium]|nr:PTS-dependent dihydroxyacetone kinase phosphotransferase subunit DhaM [Lachnospiraceae bacterium]